MSNICPPISFPPSLKITKWNLFRKVIVRQTQPSSILNFSSIFNASFHLYNEWFSLHLTQCRWKQIQICHVILHQLNRIYFLFKKQTIIKISKATKKIAKYSLPISLIIFSVCERIRYKSNTSFFFFEHPCFYILTNSVCIVKAVLTNHIQKIDLFQLYFLIIWTWGCGKRLRN